VLKAEGLRVSLVNSNPATIMTDPEVADATYIEPLTPEFVEKVIARERPDALLATLGGQTALNIAIGLYENGVLERYGVRLIGADVDAINRGEDRQQFKDIVRPSAPTPPLAGLREHRGGAGDRPAEVGYPVVIRPSFTMGGLGSGIATDEPMLRRMASHGSRTPRCTPCSSRSRCSAGRSTSSS
jgi:carbamoyl-phosphate synthase large subunit